MRIRTLKLAFVYSQTVDGLLMGALPQPAPMPFLARAPDYVAHYEKVRTRMKALADPIDNKPYWQGKEERYDAQKAISTSGELLPPWPWLFLTDRYVHHFWQYYLNNSPNLVPAQQLWEHITPFQLGLPVDIRPTTPAAWLQKLDAELYIYPHGVSTIIHATLRFNSAQESPVDTDDAYIEDAMDCVVQARSAFEYRLTLNGINKGAMKLEIIAQRLLDAAREAAFGKDLAGSTYEATPLSVATVVQATHVNVNQPIPPQSLLHLMLKALCDHKRGMDWKIAEPNAKPTELRDADLLMDKAIQSTDERSEAVYHLQRGRAVWIPRYLQPPQPGLKIPQKLSCYHRNLTLVFMQTEMLRRAMSLFLNHRDNAELRTLAMQSGMQLHKLYGRLRDDDGNKLTYNSSTPRVYLDENKYTQRVNEGLKELGLPGLEPPQSPK